MYVNYVRMHIESTLVSEPVKLLLLVVIILLVGELCLIEPKKDAENWFLHLNFVVVFTAFYCTSFCYMHIVYR